MPHTHTHRHIPQRSFTLLRISLRHACTHNRPRARNGSAAEKEREKGRARGSRETGLAWHVCVQARAAGVSRARI